MTNQTNRRLFHVLGGLAIVTGALLNSRSTAVTVLGILALFLVAAELLRRRSSAVNRWFTAIFAAVMRSEEQSKHVTGSAYFLVSSFVLFLLFARDIAILAVAFLSLGDTAASVVGQRYGGGKSRGKTLVGSLACFAACLAAGAVLCRVVPLTLAQILVGAAAATLAEAVPSPVNDNLTIPLFSAAAMALAGFLL